MKNRSMRIQLLQNIAKGKIAEEIAIKDYQSHGYKIIKTGIGSDFIAIKKDKKTTYREYVDVKSGNAKLSKKQLNTKNRVKRLGVSYSVYRVTDAYLEYLRSESYFLDSKNIAKYDHNFIVQGSNLGDYQI